MVDLETYGLRPGSIIRSIGAVFFDKHRRTIGEKYYANIEQESCEKVGMTMDQSTVDWWSRQPKTTRDQLLVDPRPIKDVMQDFARWFNRNAGFYVWSQGANFDTVLVENAMARVSVPVPWKFWNTRDTRTAYDMGDLTSSLMPRREGTYHNALDDATHQATCVQMAYERIKL